MTAIRTLVALVAGLVLRPFESRRPVESDR